MVILKNQTPEKIFDDPNDFYTEMESNRYDKSNGMRRTQEELTDIALSFSNFKNLDISILDIGCGTGFSMEYLKNKGYLSIKGIDPSKEMLKIAKFKKLNVKLGGFQDLSKIYEKYDFIYSISALHWVISNKSEIEIKNIIKKIGKDLKNILKKEGVCVIQFYPDSEKTFKIVFNSFSRIFSSSSIYIHNTNSLKKRKFFLILKH